MYLRVRGATMNLFCPVMLGNELFKLGDKLVEVGTGAFGHHGDGDLGDHQFGKRSGEHLERRVDLLQPLLEPWVSSEQFCEFCFACDCPYEIEIIRSRGRGMSLIDFVGIHGAAVLSSVDEVNKEFAGLESLCTDTRFAGEV